MLTIIPFNSYFHISYFYLSCHQPCHLCTRCKLSIHKHLEILEHCTISWFMFVFVLLSINYLYFRLGPTIVDIHNGKHIPEGSKISGSFTSTNQIKVMRSIDLQIDTYNHLRSKSNYSFEESIDYHLRGWNSYLTQCWQPFPFTWS